MKTLYIECKMGAAGDMLTAALLDLLPEADRESAIKNLQEIAPEGVEISCQPMVKWGINGKHVTIKINDEEEEAAHHHEHHHISDIVTIVQNMNISDVVRQDVLNVYNLLSQAESHAHGKKVEEIHFHEVGNKDAIMDITSVCYLMNLIGADTIMASPINVGGGQVWCAHGIMPVPAPATEYLLRGIPYYEGDIKSELCTPTGAALLKYYAKSFGPKPMMLVKNTGVGCGKKDFPAANCVRIFECESADAHGDLDDKVLQLDTNVDDMTAEEIAFAINRLFAVGAQEVFTTSVYMKKNRPGTLISVICTQSKKDQIIKAFFKHTTTIGIREKVCERNILKREITSIKTSLGDVRKKTSEGYGTKRSKLEFDDLEKIALKKDISIRQARSLVEKETNE